MISACDYSGTLSAEGLTQFNIYRSNDGTSFVRIAQVAYQSDTHFDYFDATGIGTYHYQVKAQFELSSGTCESDPAHPLNNPTGNSVTVTVTSTADNMEEHMKVFPNPIASVLHVEAQDLLRIAVSNSMGQCLMEQDVIGNNTDIDLSHFENGMYLLHITTQNGVAVRQIHLMR